MSMNMTVYQIVNEFKGVDEVVAITLAGSGASGRKDTFSDIDINIIVSEHISVDKREAIIKKFSDIMEINNTFWGESDEFILRNSNTQVDIAYFNIEWLNEGLVNVLEKCNASTGYTTCFWHNVKNSLIVFDRNNKFKELQNKYNIEYPKELKRNIINKNYPILKDGFSAYYYQIEKAINRKDIVSINHRVSGFLASYFDIIFALNNMAHPGEKRIVSIIERECALIPVNFRENIENLILSSNYPNGEILNNLTEIVNSLKVILLQEGLIEEVEKVNI